MPQCDLGTPHCVLALSDGRLLAPAITRPSRWRMGEQALLSISDDGGDTWAEPIALFEDEERKFAYFEMKLSRIGSRSVIAVCWTTTMGERIDQANSFRLSDDNGSTWGPVQSTSIFGQTMTPVSLGEDRLLVLYNRRYGVPGVVMCLVRFTKSTWTLHYEDLMYDAGAASSPQNEPESFAFGFPTAIPLQDGSYLATHWCKENGRFGIRWTKLQVNW